MINDFIVHDHNHFRTLGGKWKMVFSQFLKPKFPESCLFKTPTAFSKYVSPKGLDISRNGDADALK